jgi:N-dimethylarginine dimethylaminohydrolase
LPDGLVLEGAGDCSFDRARNLSWMGYGSRSDAASRAAVEEAFGIEAVVLELADARFYHIDTALCPLPRGEVLYVPGAFTAQDRSEIRARIAPEQRIELGIDGVQLAANAVCLGDAIVLSGCSERLRAELEERGYRVVPRRLGSLLRSGGAAFCLMLRLDRRSAAHAGLATSAAA